MDISVGGNIAPDRCVMDNSVGGNIANRSAAQDNERKSVRLAVAIGAVPCAVRCSYRVTAATSGIKLQMSANHGALKKFKVPCLFCSASLQMQAASGPAGASP